MSNLAPTDEADDIDGTCSSILCTINPRVRDIGGFHVRRVLPDHQHQMVGPWIFFDEMGPKTFSAGEGIDVRPHPHINLATVTYLFEGEIFHRDSLGSAQPIRPGEINLMVAGKGIVHSERTPPEIRTAPHTTHGLQLWLALPRESEEVDPEFLHYASDDIPSTEPSPGANVRIMIGEGYGLVSPVKTFSPTFYAEVFLEAGAQIDLPDDMAQRGVYLVSGQLKAKESVLAEKNMTVFSKEKGIRLQAEQPAHFVIIGGEPVGERYIWWNFVSSRKDRIEQGKLDWDQGKFPSVPGDEEYIPLPE